MLRISLIGLGMAVEPHARSLLELRDRVEVCWAASRSVERTRAFAARYPFPVTNDVTAAIQDRTVDAVILLTPPDTHLELAQQAFAHGKHLLIEKPLDVTLERAAAIVAAAEAADLRLGTVLQHRFRSGALRLAEILEQEALGSIQAASLIVPWWRAQNYYDEPGRGTLRRDGGGVLMTQAIHSLDLFRALLGPIEVQAAHACTTAVHTMETEDLVSALLRLRNGATGTLMATTAFFPGHPERIEVIGEFGSAQLVGSALSVHWMNGIEEHVAASAQTGSGAAAMNFSHDAHKSLIADFCHAVEYGRAPQVSGHDALATQQLIQELLSKARQA